MALKLLKRAIQNARRHGLRIIHFSLQSNHVHLIVEAQNNETLITGMRALTISFAKGLKKKQIERYHLHVLKTLQETKNAVYYVLFNKQKHEKGRYSQLDEFTSEITKKMAQHFSKISRMTLKYFEGERGDMAKSYFLSTIDLR